MLSCTDGDTAGRTNRTNRFPDINHKLPLLITDRKRSLGQGNIFTPVCHSVHRGVCLSAGWDTNPPGPGNPQEQTPLGPGSPQEQTPPPQEQTLRELAPLCEGYVFTPVCQSFCLRGGSAPVYYGIHPHWEADPPGSRPPCTVHAGRYGQQRAVCILLECILVLDIFLDIFFKNDNLGIKN